MSSSQTADAGGSSVSVVEDKGDSDLKSFVIVAPVVVELDRCDAMGIVRSDSLGENEGLLLVV
eukprot:1550666-Ditylum_brightwellii.AAC.1